MKINNAKTIFIPTFLGILLFYSRSRVLILFTKLAFLNSLPIPLAFRIHDKLPQQMKIEESLNKIQRLKSIHFRTSFTVKKSIMGFLFRIWTQTSKLAAGRLKFLHIFFVNFRFNFRFRVVYRYS